MGFVQWWFNSDLINTNGDSMGCVLICLPKQLVTLSTNNSDLSIHNGDLANYNGDLTIKKNEDSDGYSF